MVLLGRGASSNPISIAFKHASLSLPNFKACRHSWRWATENSFMVTKLLQNIQYCLLYICCIHGNLGQHSEKIVKPCTETLQMKCTEFCKEGLLTKQSLQHWCDNQQDIIGRLAILPNLVRSCQETGHYSRAGPSKGEELTAMRCPKSCSCMSASARKAHIRICFCLSFRPGLL